MKLNIKLVITRGSLILLFLLLSACGVDGTGGAGGGDIAAKGDLTVAGSIDSTDAELSVNNTTFNTEDAQVTLDGEQASSSELEPGQVVLIRGDSSTAETSVVAQEINYLSNVIGPISTIDQVNSKFTVLGQTVWIDNLTVLGEGVETFSQLATGEILRVSGLMDSMGDIYATRIDEFSGVANHQVVGLVEALDLATMTFSINELRIKAQLPAGLAEGMLVKITGFEFNQDNEFEASTVEVIDNDLGDSGQQINLEGLITRFESSEDFDVSGYTLTTNQETIVENGTLEDLNLDARIEVYGELNEQAIVVAERIVIIHTGPQHHRGSLAYYTPIRFTVETSEDDVGFWVSTQSLGGRYHLYVHRADNQTPIAQCIEDNWNNLLIGGCPWAADVSFTEECRGRHLTAESEGLCYLENLEPGTWNVVLIALDPIDYEVDIYKRRLGFSEPEVITAGDMLTLNMRKGDRRLFSIPVDSAFSEQFLAIMLEGLGNDAQMQVYGELIDENWLVGLNPLGSGERCTLTSEEVRSVCWLLNSFNTESWTIDIASFVDKEYRLHTDFAEVDVIDIGQEITAEITRPQGELYQMLVPDTALSLSVELEGQSSSTLMRVHSLAPGYIGNEKDDALCTLTTVDNQCVVQHEGQYWRHFFVRGDVGSGYTFNTQIQAQEPDTQTLALGQTVDVSDQAAGVIATYRLPRGEKNTVYAIGIDEIGEASDFVLTVRKNEGDQDLICELGVAAQYQRICRVANDNSPGEWFIEVKSTKVGSYQLWSTEQAITELTSDEVQSATFLPEDTLLGHLYKVQQVEAGTEFVAELTNKIGATSIVGTVRALPATEDFDCGGAVPSTEDSDCQVEVNILDTVYLLINGESGAGYSVSVQENL